MNVKADLQLGSEAGILEVVREEKYHETPILQVDPTESLHRTDRRMLGGLCERATQFHSEIR